MTGSAHRVGRPLQRLGWRWDPALVAPVRAEAAVVGCLVADVRLGVVVRVCG